MATSEIPALWIWVGALIWAIAGFVWVVKGQWLAMPEKSDAFPFSARQFFLMLIALLFAFGLYVASFLIAHSLTEAFQHLPPALSLGLNSKPEVQALEQLFAIILGTAGVWIVSSLLPDDLAGLVMGKSGGWKKWLKGVGLGFLFVPVIFFVTWVIGTIISLTTSEERSLQLSLEMLVNLRGTSFLFWILAPIVIFIVPYVEEMLFRGFLQGFLNGLLHPTLAVLCTSAVFALFHYSPLQKSSNFEIMAGLFVFSILASNVRAKEDSIWASIGLHAAFNATSLCLFFRLT